MSRVCNLDSENPGIADVVNPEQEVESPSKCTCQDQSEVQAPFNIKVPIIYFFDGRSLVKICINRVSSFK